MLHGDNRDATAGTVSRALQLVSRGLQLRLRNDAFYNRRCVLHSGLPISCILWISVYEHLLKIDSLLKTLRNVIRTASRLLDNHAFWLHGFLLSFIMPSFTMQSCICHWTYTQHHEFTHNTTHNTTSNTTPHTAQKLEPHNSLKINIKRVWIFLLISDISAYQFVFSQWWKFSNDGNPICLKLTIVFFIDRYVVTDDFWQIFFDRYFKFLRTILDMTSTHWIRKNQHGWILLLHNLENTEKRIVF